MAGVLILIIVISSSSISDSNSSTETETETFVLWVVVWVVQLLIDSQTLAKIVSYPRDR